MRSAERGVRNAERLHFISFRSQGKFVNAKCKMQNAELLRYVSLHSQCDKVKNALAILSPKKRASLDEIRTKKIPPMGAY